MRFPFGILAIAAAVLGLISPTLAPTVFVIGVISVIGIPLALLAMIFPSYACWWCWPMWLSGYGPTRRPSASPGLS